MENQQNDSKDSIPHKGDVFWDWSWSSKSGSSMSRYETDKKKPHYVQEKHSITKHYQHSKHVWYEENFLTLEMLYLYTP